ncbi:hypothetical protein ACFSPU_06255 [Haoranjiania flava]|uniref:hypothetical protein n=1 Tax=Haoranjiania flava TaxID=1856322 RepID=UPI00362C7658
MNRAILPLSFFWIVFPLQARWLNKSFETQGPHGWHKVHYYCREDTEALSFFWIFICRANILNKSFETQGLQGWHKVHYYCHEHTEPLSFLHYISLSFLINLPICLLAAKK